LKFSSSTIGTSSSSSTSRRQLELDAYAAVVTAFKAQGELTWKKYSLLQDLRAVLKISDDRHKMEAKRAEDTLSYASLTPTKKNKQQPGSPTTSVADVDVGSDMSESSDKESLSDGERQPKKKMKAATQKDLIHLNSYPLPSNEQPAFVNKIPSDAPKSKKETKDKKKAGRPSKSKQPQPPSSSVPSTQQAPASNTTRTNDHQTTQQQQANNSTTFSITLPGKDATTNSV